MPDSSAGAANIAAAGRSARSFWSPPRPGRSDHDERPRSQPQRLGPSPAPQARLVTQGASARNAAALYVAVGPSFFGSIGIAIDIDEPRVETHRCRRLPVFYGRRAGAGNALAAATPAHGLCLSSSGLRGRTLPDRNAIAFSGRPTIECRSTARALGWMNNHGPL
jgi:hypothetical protein